MTFVLGEFGVFGAKKSKAFEVATTLSSDTTTTLDFLGLLGFLMVGAVLNNRPRLRIS